MRKNMETKKCPVCGRVLLVTEFGVNNTSVNGLQSWCRDCSHKYQDLRREYKDLGGVKLCRKCKRMLPKTEFYKSSGHSRDGYQSYCKQCCKGTAAASKHKGIMVDWDGISDADLIQVLRARGFVGTLSKKTDYSI